MCSKPRIVRKQVSARSPCTSSAGPSTGSSLPTSRLLRREPAPPATTTAVLRACEAVIKRMAIDRHYFARPARTLFCDIRSYFPMSAQQHVHQVVCRYIDYAEQFLVEHPHEGYAAVSGAPPQCRATTRKGAACQRMPLPTTATARPTSTWPTPRIASSPPREPHVGSRACSWGSTSAGPSPTPCSSARTPPFTPPRSPPPPASSPSPCSTRCARCSRALARVPRQVERFAHGMTVATNALLEGRTARTALIATDGFTDVIELGRQARPRLYELCVAAPAPLVPAELRFAAPERMAPRARSGRSIPAPRARSWRSSPPPGRRRSPSSLLHSYADPAHERLLGALLAELLPEVHVSLSCDLVGTFREYERTATTVLDAALSPLLGGYLRRLSTDARERRAARAADHAVLRRPHRRRARRRPCRAHRALGARRRRRRGAPAGGARAASANVLCFDMGGTSCDVCLIDASQVAETAERTVAGRPLALPALDIHTVGAGGGSIAWRDPGGALRVGPASAGADPGPACYGRGGRRAADRHRRQPPARPAARGLAARGRDLARPRRRRARRRCASRASSTWR